MKVVDTILIAPIRWFLENVLELCYAYTHNYGVSLLLLSVVVSVLLLPLYALADRWRNKDKAFQQKMKPDLDAIKKFYRGQERHYSIRTAYRIYGYSPLYVLQTSMGFLIQIPFFLAAYTLLSHYKGLEGMSFGIIEDLARPDGLFLGIHVLPFIMTGVNIVAGLVYLQNLQKNDILQLVGLSLFFLVVLYNSSAGLVLYWTTNNVCSLIKYIFINKPKVREYLVRTRHLVSQGLRHRYTSNVTRVLLITAGYLMCAYVISTVRSAELPGVTLRIGILLMLLCNTGMTLKIALYKELRKRIVTWVSIFFTVLGGAATILLRFLVYTSLETLRVSSVTLTQNRLQQLIAGSLIVAAACVYPMYTRKSVPLCRVSKAVSNTPKKHAIIALCSAIGIFFILNPLTTYINSPEEYGGTIYNIIILIALISLLVYILGYVAIILLYRISKTAYALMAILLYWATLIAIIYGFIIDLKLGVVIGERFIFDSGLNAIEGWTILLEPILWISALVLFIIYFSKIRALLSILLVTLTLLIAGNTTRTLLTRMELFALSDNTPADSHQNTFPDIEATLPPYHEEIAAFSKEKNILLVILDAYPADLLDTVLVQHPELIKKLDGFVWHKNTVSISSRTYTSAAAMIAGHNYLPMTISGHPNDTIESAWEYWPAQLKNYDVSYINPFYGNTQKLTSLFDADRFRIHNVGYDYFEYWKHTHPNAQITQEVLREVFHVPKWINMSVFRILPVHLKQKLYLDATWKIFVSGSRTNFYYELNNFHNKFANTYVVLDSLSKTSITGAPRPTLKVIWDTTMHFPFYMNKSCTGVEKEAIVDGSHELYLDTNAMTPMYCTLRTITHWIDWMKQERIYDNTKIIIASDHGSSNVMYNSEGEKYPVDNAIFALLMVKDFNQSGELQISHLFMSNADIPSIIGSAVPEQNFPGLNKDPTVYTRNTPLAYYVKTSNSEYYNNILNIKYYILVENDVYDRENWTYINVE